MATRAQRIFARRGLYLPPRTIRVGGANFFQVASRASLADAREVARLVRKHGARTRILRFPRKTSLGHTHGIYASKRTMSWVWDVK